MFEIGDLNRNGQRLLAKTQFNEADHDRSIVTVAAMFTA